MIDVNIRPASWQSDEQALRHIREQVFINEQHVPVELEWDGMDESAMHWLATDSHNKVIGTVRLLSNGHIGRMAVLAEYRGKGIGSSLLKAVMGMAKTSGMPELFLNAQTDALGFYEKFGFIAEGDVFDDAGIPHKKMRLILPGLY